MCCVVGVDACGAAWVLLALTMNSDQPTGPHNSSTDPATIVSIPEMYTQYLHIP
jgi:hypothetical protein